MKSKLMKSIASLLGSVALLAGTAQGMLLANALERTEPCIYFDYESYDGKSYYCNSDGIFYYQGTYPLFGEICQDGGFDTWIRAPKVIDFSGAVQEIMATQDSSAKLAVVISPECLDHVAFAEEIAQYKEEHTLYGMTYAEIDDAYDTLRREFGKFEEENRLYRESEDEILARFLTEKTGSPTWNEPWTIKDISMIHTEVGNYSWELAETELAKERERVESLGFDLQEGNGIRTVMTVEQLQNFVPSDKLGYTISLQFLAPTEEISSGSPVKIERVMSGDTNGDGEIGVVDAVLLQKWLLGIGELPNWQSADLCEDGVINIYDLLKLKQMLTCI